VTSESNTPLEIGPTEDGLALRIQWEDRHESVWTPRDLRLACPCAGCVDEFTGEKILSEAGIHKSVYPLSIEYVGNYAIQFNWSDGHNTGIYSFGLLRAMCSCDICSSS
jgi:DUF971 family protein